MQVYADNAATTRMHQTAIDTMTYHLNNTFGNPSSLYTIGQQAKEVLETARADMAACFGAQPREIYFTSGGSEADNQAITYLGARKGKKHIISTTFEHHAVLHTLKRLEKQGFEVTLLDVHADGLVSAQQVADAIRDDTCLVTIMFANNEIGTIQPIEAIGAVCHERGVLFHTDAVQAAGHVKIDVNAMHIDLLSLSAHKFHGPKGVGMLYARRGIILTNLIEGGAQERGKRGGTENVPGIAAMAAALTEACANMDENTKKVTALRDKLIDGLDGLAAGSSAIIGVALGILAYMSSHFEFASFLNIMFIPGAEELVVFAAAFIGATVGFLWYNAYPAQVFMGDTGSLTLGGIIAVFAIIIRKELLIPILCGIFLVENLSVLMQTFYFKYTKKKYGEGRRIFKMAPLHHHFQKPGNAGIQALIQKPFNVVPESKIVVRFWLIGIILAVVTIVTLKMR